MIRYEDHSGGFEYEADLGELLEERVEPVQGNGTCEARGCTAPAEVTVRYAVETRWGAYPETIDLCRECWEEGRGA